MTYEKILRRFANIQNLQQKETYNLGKIYKRKWGLQKMHMQGLPVIGIIEEVEENLLDKCLYLDRLWNHYLDADCQLYRKERELGLHPEDDDM